MKANLRCGDASSAGCHPALCECVAEHLRKDKTEIRRLRALLRRWMTLVGLQTWSSILYTDTNKALAPKRRRKKP